ncbi:MAG: ATP-binding cassette domain-containing protein [Gaiellaceae bacterium MAG52_C11]|nr:ATP-binding cassette domain-containing protein [Candidatus Gaiellasilicea maunaloa]
MSGRIVCRNLVKVYKTEDVEVVALQGLDLLVEPGELVAVVGASGSGKSTLQSILAGLEPPTAGAAEVAGWDLTSLPERRRREFRLRTVGFVWQQTAANLVPYLTVAENVAVPLLLTGAPLRRRRLRIAETLELIGLRELADADAESLSSGEQQLLAVAVALANSPSVLLADEPTAELDSESSGRLFDVFRTVSAAGVTVVVTTHDPLVSTSVERTITIRDGRTSAETIRRAAGAAGEEFAVLDAAGRLQLPPEYVQALGLTGRVRVVLDENSIEVRPEHGRRRAEP